MKKTTLTATLTFAAFLATTSAQAGLADDVIADLTSQGYTSIQVNQGAFNLKVQAVKDGVKRELVYNTLTGDLVKDESSGIDDSSDDDSSDDSSDDDSGDDDSGDDDNSGDGDSGDDDSDGGDSGGDDNSGGGSGGGDSGGGSGNGGGDDAFLLETPNDYLTGGHGIDIDFA